MCIFIFIYIYIYICLLGLLRASSSQSRVWHEVLYRRYRILSDCWVVLKGPLSRNLSMIPGLGFRDVSIIRDVLLNKGGWGSLP